MSKKPTLYSFEVTDIEGKTISLASFKNSVLLIVNTASEGVFKPQYAELETLYRTYRDRGFVVLAFPSNDFGKREPNKEQPTFSDVQFRTTFPLFEPVHVKGKHVHPLFKFLADKDQNGVLNSKPRWNFHKYLINRKGQVVDYFFPFTPPTSDRVCNAIEALL